MVLANDAPRDYELADLNELPMVADDIIYEGAAVGDNASGYARPLVAGDPFRGFATRRVDNTDGSAGDKRVQVQERGKIVLNVTGVTGVGDVGKLVFASDDGTFTLAAGSNSYIGKIARHVSSTKCLVAFDARMIDDNAISVTADDSESVLNLIPVGVKNVIVAGVTNGTDDFVVLPSCTNLPTGYTIVVHNASGGACELRTPAASDEKINAVDADGDKELALPDASTTLCIRSTNTDGWICLIVSSASAITAAGVAPD